MPLVEYRCAACHNTIEVIQKFSDPDLVNCSNCGGSLERLLSAPAIHFKGSGWYVNDYSRKASNGNGSEAKSTPAESPAPSTETKAATAESK